MRSLLGNRSFWALTITQFLGAFNDSVFRWFLLKLSESEVLAGISWLPEDRQGLILGVFSVPFVIFALLGGSLADRHSKRTITVVLKAMEVVVMAFGTLALALHAIDASWIEATVIASLLVLFLMGTHSAFFSPAKYGVIPQLVDEHELTRANGIINMTTQVGILLGIMCGEELIGIILSKGLPLYYSGAVFIAIALLGLISSIFMRRLPPADPTRKLLWNFPVHMVRETRYVAGDKELFLGLLAQCWWWLIAALALPAINRFGTDVLSIQMTGKTMLLPLAAGTAAGSLLTSTLSGKRVELGLVPIGAIGMGLGFSAFYYMEPTYWNACVALIVAGVFGGLFFVPLAAFTQQRPREEEKGRIMGFAEMSNFFFIFLGAVVYALMVNWLEMDPGLVMLATGLLTLAGAAVICSLTPHYMMRLFLWVLTHSFYKIRVLHPDRVPMHGGALLVCNHVSYADPFLVGASVPRYVRYLMHRGFLNVPVVGWFGALMKAIPIADSDGPRALVRSLDEASKHLERGHLACIFAEGAISRTGNLLPFSKGLERIAGRAGVPIVPMYIDRMWGSIFSFRGGKFSFKPPYRIPYPVTVVFGAPLTPSTSIDRVRRAVQELGAEAFDARMNIGETLATRFLRIARRYPRRLAMVDHTRREISFQKLLIALLLLRKMLRKRLREETHVGVLLPASSGGAIANILLALLGKVSVNLNFTAGKDVYESAIEQCKITTIITARPFLEKLEIPPNVSHLFLDETISGATRGQKIRAALKALLPGSVLAHLAGVPHHPETDATIIFSSGSTGSPKGVCLTHHNILSNSRSLTQVFDVSKEDRVVGVLPFFHSFGYTATLWFPMLNGLAALFHVNPTEARPIAELLRKYRGTIFMSTPTFYQGYLRRFAEEDFASVRIAAAGAEKLKPALAKLWFEKFGVPLMEGYGCTELSPVVSVNLPDFVQGSVHQRAGKPGSIGHPLPGIAAKIVDPETFEDRGVGMEGMLLIKGPNVMRGYLNRPDLTAEVIRDGWYVTGDIAAIDAEGFITITDRMSRFSKIGGEMVPHVHVESEIQAIVLELQSCSIEAEVAGECAEVAVTSVPDETKGERLAVLHTPLSFPLDDVLARLRERGLSNLWIPRKEFFIAVDKIPKLGSGKFDLRALKLIANERLGARAPGAAT